LAIHCQYSLNFQLVIIEAFFTTKVVVVTLRPYSHLHDLEAMLSIGIIAVVVAAIVLVFTGYYCFIVALLEIDVTFKGVYD